LTICQEIVPDQILAEPASTYEEQANAGKAVEYWIRQVKLGRSEMQHEAKLGRLFDCSSRGPRVGGDCGAKHFGLLVGLIEWLHRFRIGKVSQNLL
jgi:hypothetical protein